MSDLPILLPLPRQMAVGDGTLALPQQGLIVLDGPDAGALFFSAKRLQAALAERANVHWEIVAGNAVPHDQIAAILSIVVGGTCHPQGYELTITPDGIHAVASTPTGVFYAVCTLVQLLGVRDQGSGGRSQESGVSSSLQPLTSNLQLPTLRISDWPDFPDRGVMLDVSRDKVPTMQTLFELVDLLAAWKINQLQLYTEHTFAYRNHPEVWAEASPMTGEEILALDAYCRERFIELVPNQNSFGHMKRWLNHERYRPLAEAPDGCDTRWGHYDYPLSLCPVDPGSIALVRSIFDELLPHFSSRQFNVGCDETVDLGQGRSKEAVEQLGAGRVYLDFLLQIYREVKARGRTMQFWGDIIMQHPELVPELPRDAIALEWGYEADHPFDAARGDLRRVRHAVLRLPRHRHLEHHRGPDGERARQPAQRGRKRPQARRGGLSQHRLGRRRPLAAAAGELPGFRLWCGALLGVSTPIVDMDIAQAISVYAFDDPTGTLGRVAFDLGNAYQKTGVEIHNSTVMVRMLQATYEQFAASRSRYPGLNAEGLMAAEAEVDRVMARYGEVKSGRKDADLIRREYAWAADMLRHGSRRGVWMLGKQDGHEDAALRAALAADAERLIAEYGVLWHARSRPGGFGESVGRMEKMRRDYLS